MAAGILVQLSRIDDMETFKICLEYWQWLGKVRTKALPLCCASTVVLI
eukprot:SAG22_NODE_2483_length_2525_cov_5.067601_3_plen_48_part_00